MDDMNEFEQWFAEGDGNFLAAGEEPLGPEAQESFGDAGEEAPEGLDGAQVAREPLPQGQEGQEPSEGVSRDGENGESPETARESPEAGNADAAGQETPAQQEAAWTVETGDGARTVRAGEITPELLGKGLDYDRVKAGLEEAQPVMELFRGLAQQAGMSVADYTAFIRTEAKKAQGMDAETAKRTVALEDRERAVAALEAQKQEADRTRDARSQRVREDVAEFARAFPEVYARAKDDPKAIPVAVWDAVNAGESLTAAWAKHSVAEAQAQMRAAERRAGAEELARTNAGRSTGSMATTGSGEKKDPFLEGFDAGFAW